MMEQNTTTTMPVMDNSNQKSGNGLKIATTVAFIVAICGIGFGAYGMIQNTQKDEEISKKDAQITNLESQIKDNGDINNAIETTIDETITDGPKTKTCVGEYSGTAAIGSNAQTGEYINGTLTIKLTANGTYELLKEGMNGDSGDYAIIDNALLLKTAPHICNPESMDCSAKYSQFLTIDENCSEITSGYGSYFFEPNFTLLKQ